MTDKLDVEAIRRMREHAGPCLVPKEGVGGITCHERSGVCACMTDALLAALAAKDEEIEAIRKHYGALVNQAQKMQTEAEEERDMFRRQAVDQGNRREEAESRVAVAEKERETARGALRHSEFCRSEGNKQIAILQARLAQASDALRTADTVIVQFSPRDGYCWYCGYQQPEHREGCPIAGYHKSLAAFRQSVPTSEEEGPEQICPCGGDPNCEKGHLHEAVYKDVNRPGAASGEAGDR